jgi:hypothetical protein
MLMNELLNDRMIEWLLIGNHFVQIRNFFL